MSKQRKISKWLKYKFRIVFTSYESFEERKKFKFNRLGFLSLSLLAAIIIITITSVTIAYTPLRELIPGYPDKETKKAIIANAIRLDSLENEILLRDQYLLNMKQVLLGEEPFNPELELSSEARDSSAQNISISDQVISRNTEVNTSNFTPSNSANELPWSTIFFPPVKGVITNSFDPAHGHYGTDIVTPDNETVHASLDGTIILANWTIETGYTIQIQHNHNYITVYRHLKKITKNSGDKVSAGDIIGYYGNTGEISFGPHLHFEIWHNGTPVDPEKLIEF